MAESLTITVSWPDRVLWPNSRAHWAKKVTPKRIQKLVAYSAMLDAGGMSWCNKPFSIVTVSMVFHPTANRRFDLDNAQAAMKAAIDGISLYLNIDDSKFKFMSERGEKVEGGAVVITVTGLK